MDKYLTHIWQHHYQDNYFIIHYELIAVTLYKTVWVFRSLVDIFTIRKYMHTYSKKKLSLSQRAIHLKTNEPLIIKKIYSFITIFRNDAEIIVSCLDFAFLKIWWDDILLNR